MATLGRVARGHRYHRHCNQGKKQKQFTFQRVLLDLRETLQRRGFEQIPQLTSSRNLELNETPFTLRNTSTTNNTNTNNQGICRALLVGINYIGQNGQLVSF